TNKVDLPEYHPAWHPGKVAAYRVATRAHTAGPSITKGVRMRAVQVARTCVAAGSLLSLVQAPSTMAQPATAAVPPVMAAAGDGQHDFDFEFGSWRAHLRRRVHPLSGSDTWVEYDGTSVIHKLWDGRANIGELEVGNSTTHIQGISLRL